MSSQAERGERFRALHAGEPFVIPNPWDAGSARVLEGLGFEALATTSSGFAFTLGRRDGGATLDDVAAHVRAVAEAGAVGGSIEDYDRERGIYELDHAVERVAGAVEAARLLDFPFTVTARA